MLLAMGSGCHCLTPRWDHPVRGKKAQGSHRFCMMVSCIYFIICHKVIIIQIKCTIKVRHWRRKGQPTPAFLPGESQGQRSLAGCRLWGRTESDMTEAT